MSTLHWQPRLLLVGEGNFSFSVNLCKRKGCESHIIATCYESEDTASRQAFVKSNVQYLRDRGAEVHFSIDCTKLMEYFSPDERDFNCIYFNFPHCGRKAGVKKNRELLARFFRSCAEVLAEKGEIHVALCRGQGGTSADKPMREWQNSWQIVAMAAEAGFLLSNVVPFNTGDSCGYKCTGYRSQDKSFHLEGALNHIFTRSLPFPNPKPVICQTELGGKLVSFVVPEIFQDKMNRGFLDVNSEHPVSIINDKLIEELGKSFPVQKMNSPLPMVFQGGQDMISSPEDLWTVPVAKRNFSPKSMVNRNGKDSGVFASLSGFPGWEHLCEHTQERDWILGQFYLRPSILVFLPAVIQQEFPLGTLLILSGEAFRKSKISAYSLPVFHESAFICRINRGMKGRWLQGLTESLIQALNSLHQSSDFKLHCVSDEPETAQVNTLVVGEPHHFRSNYLITVTIDTSASDPKVLSVGRVGILPWQLPCIDQEMVYVSLNLDLLAMYLCGIEDWRMLWTFDSRFQTQFMGGHLGPFKNFSLYPPSYVHDVSFWVPEPEMFNEIQLHTIARTVSREMIVSFQLLDRFQNPDTRQTSFCYRATYQSCDKALTRQQVAEMQVKLRNEIQHSLQPFIDCYAMFPVSSENPSFWIL